MWLDVLLILVGLVVLIASMVLFLNPPEAWVKRAFLRDKNKKKD